MRKSVIALLLLTAFVGCKTKRAMVVESGSLRAAPTPEMRAELASQIRLGMDEASVVRIMGSRPVSRWEDPDFEQVVCFWFYSHTHIRAMADFKGDSYWMKFESGKLVGILASDPKLTVGDVTFSDDARWHFRKHVYAHMAANYHRAIGKQMYFNDATRHYVLGDVGREVDRWEGATCHWKALPVKAGYTRHYSPDKVYSIDVPNDKECVAYLGNGRFRLAPKGGASAAPAAKTSGGGGFGGFMAEMAGAMVGAAVQGAADGLVQGLASGVADAVVNRGGGGGSGGGAVYTPVQTGAGSGGTKSSVRPRIRHSYCHGTGECQICHRKGYVGTNIRCKGCNGTGRCAACHGTGWAN